MREEKIDKGVSKREATDLMQVFFLLTTPQPSKREAQA